MKLHKLLILIFLVPTVLFSQKKADYGLTIGGSYYLGDINPVFQFVSTSSAGGLFYRHTINLRYSLRSTLIYGKIKAEDAFFKNEYQELRNHSFSTNYLDLSNQLEFNFFPYQTTSLKYRVTPYVSAGLGFTVFSDVSTLTIPFGIGGKFNVTERWSIGLEWTWKRTFTDEIDGLGDYPYDPTGQAVYDNEKDLFKQYSVKYRKDWHVYFGFFISYKLFYKRYTCPAYGEMDMYE